MVVRPALEATRRRRAGRRRLPARDDRELRLHERRAQALLRHDLPRGRRGARPTTARRAAAAAGKKPFGLCVHGRYDTTGAVRSVQSIVRALPGGRRPRCWRCSATSTRTQRAAAYELGGTLAALLDRTEPPSRTPRGTIGRVPRRPRRSVPLARRPSRPSLRRRLSRWPSPPAATRTRRERRPRPGRRGRGARARRLPGADARRRRPAEQRHQDRRLRRGAHRARPTRSAPLPDALEDADVRRRGARGVRLRRPARRSSWSSSAPTRAS